MTQEFMGTFGVRYKREPHPSGKEVDPDGYVLIHAEDFNEAIQMMQAEYGTAYAFVYGARGFSENSFGLTGYDHHPLGVIAVLGEPG